MNIHNFYHISINIPGFFLPVIFEYLFEINDKFDY